MEFYIHEMEWNGVALASSKMTVKIFLDVKTSIFGHKTCLMRSDEKFLILTFHGLYPSDFETSFTSRYDISRDP